MQTTNLTNPFYNEKSDEQKRDKRTKRNMDRIDSLVSHMIYIDATKRYFMIQHCLYRCLSDDCALFVFEMLGIVQPLYSQHR